MSICLRRREFITLLSGAAAWPLAARAQQSALPVVGYLSSGSQGISGERLRMFLGGLSDAGLSEGKNITIEYRWAEGQYDRLPQLAADLVGRRGPVPLEVIEGLSHPVTAPGSASSSAVRGPGYAGRSAPWRDPRFSRIVASPSTNCCR